MLNKHLRQITEAILNEDRETVRPDPHALTAFCETALLPDLFYCADKIRRHFMGDRFQTCVIVNAKSGACAEDCAFCAQSVHHRTHAPVHGLLPEDVLVEHGLRAQQDGGSHFSIVTSGAALGRGDLDAVCRVVSALRKRTDLTLCASLGMLTPDAARRLRRAGLTRYHHNLETARSFFHKVCTTHAYDDAAATVRTARQAGLEVCSGGILGMGETWAQRIELALALAELAVDGVAINFLNPIAGTRLGKMSPLPPMEALAAIALFRFVHPRRPIVVCGGREIALGDFQSWMSRAGASGLMLGHYLTTRGRDAQMDLKMIAALGGAAAKTFSRNSTSKGATHATSGN